MIIIRVFTATRFPLAQLNDERVIGPIEREKGSKDLEKLKYFCTTTIQ